jgi:dihydrofolate reductase
VGGGKLIASFREHGFIDEYIITLVPVLLGDGISMFPGNQTPGALRLVDVKWFNSGLAQLKYAVS